MTAGQEIARRALSLVGVRFRAQGRVPEHGLDCVGLVAAAVGADRARADYRIRGGLIEELAAELARAGLEPVEAAAVGDVLVMRAGPEQLHLGVVTPAGFVHADARLRRVVERPGAPPWPVLQVWRQVGEGG
jgi:cell wall-associated NlpC family hydrolase